jgi:ATP-dependent Clp protease protease subunit
MDIKSLRQQIDLEALITQLQETSNPILYQYFKNLNERKLIINNEISSEDIEFSVMPLLEWDNDGTGKEITIYLNTSGGSVYNGLVICDVLSRMKTPTTVIVLGYAYSMGALILMAGAKNPNVTRVCFPFSTGLIHGGSDMMAGTASQIKDYFNFTTKYEEKIKDYILRNTKISEDEYQKMERTEWWMTAEDMLKYGLVDEIIQ